ncbi:MAG: phosphoglycerate mutase family protein [Aggregatilineales bacterium]
MNEFWLIRHGESEGNIGGRTATPDGITLTSNGHSQARHTADQIATLPTPPVLIVHSPYLRTRQTALPLIEQYPQVPVEVWEIHEFTFLSPTEFANTTIAERRPAARAYWERANPHEVQGEGAESFAAFIARASAVHDRLKHTDTALRQRTIIYSHETFIMAVMWCQLFSGDLSADKMRGFRSFTQGFSVPNCGCLKLGFAGETVWMTLVSSL